MAKKSPPQENTFEDKYIISDTKHLEGELMRTGIVRIDSVPNLLADGNPKLHEIGLIYESIFKYNFIDEAKIDNQLTNRAGEKGAFVYGNGRIEALHWGWQEWKNGRIPEDRIPGGILYDDEFWYIPVKLGLDTKNELMAKSLILDHNNLTMMGGNFEDGDFWRMFDMEMLSDMAESIQAGGGDVVTMDSEQIADLDHYLKSSDEDEMKDQADGSLLALLDVTIDDPQHIVNKGDQFILSDTHILICAEVITGWRMWSSYLEGEKTLFCPYPGVFVPLSTRAEEYKLILVQPDKYICGHILDRYAMINGREAIKPYGNN